MKIDKLTEQILEITNNSDYGWIHSDSVDAERIRLVLSKALSLGAVVGRRDQLKAFAQFLYSKEYLVKRSIDEAIDEFEKSL